LKEDLDKREQRRLSWKERASRFATCRNLGKCLEFSRRIDQFTSHNWPVHISDGLARAVVDAIETDIRLSFVLEIISAH
jgi:hypothetical protein